MEPNVHPYEWLSLVPPILVIALAILTRRVFLSLLVGIFSGALILSKWNPIQAIEQFVTVHLWPSLIDPEKMTVFVFTMLMGAMIGVVNRSAGMRGLVDVMKGFARNRRGGQLTTWGLGLFVFFDDYANTMLLGTTMRKLCDKLRITREKLAFLVDSTAAPVAGLALISTWVAGEISYVQDGLDKLGDLEDAPSAFSLFLSSIPYRFYILWMLVFVAMVALTGRDYGPMLAAEKRGPKIDQGLDSATSSTSTDPAEATPARWHNAVLPVLVTVGAVVYFMYQTGSPESGKKLWEIFGDADPYHSLLWGTLVGYVFTLIWICPQGVISWEDTCKSSANGALHMIPALGILWLASCLSNMTKDDAPSFVADGENQAVLVVNASLAPEDSKIDLARLRAQVQSNELTARQVLYAIGESDASGQLSVREFKSLFEDKEDNVEQDQEIDQWANLDESGNVLGINKYHYFEHKLYTGDVLAKTLGEATPLWLLPTLVFVLASAIAFATGTSWGTMGILMPLFIPLSLSIMKAAGIADDTVVALNHPVMLCCIGSVLAGAIFGDHCSPISDTTVLSSQASGCDHLAHVWTQMPYALTVGGIAILTGTLPIGIVASISSLSGLGSILIWFQLPIGIALMLAVLLIFGKCPDEAQQKVDLQKENRKN